MNNQISLILVAALILTMGLGCSLLGSQGSGSSSDQKDRTISDDVVDKTVGRSKIGVPECDEVMDLIEAELSNSEDGTITKAIKATILNRIKDGIKQAVEQDGSNTQDLAATCKEFKTQFDRFKAEEASKNR